jgi:hypothetical protein
MLAIARTMVLVTRPAYSRLTQGNPTYSQCVRFDGCSAIKEC